VNTSDPTINTEDEEQNSEPRRRLPSTDQCAEGGYQQGRGNRDEEFAGVHREARTVGQETQRLRRRGAPGASEHTQIKQQGPDHDPRGETWSGRPRPALGGNRRRRHAPPDSANAFAGTVAGPPPPSCPVISRSRAVAR
jgi:hypothetical protein